MRAFALAAALALCGCQASAQEAQQEASQKVVQEASQKVLHYGPDEAYDGAEFRVFASEAVPIVEPGCAHSVVPETAAILDPVISRYNRLKASLEGRSLAIDLAIAESDHRYMLSLVDLDCAQEDTPETKEKMLVLAIQLAFHLDNMERLAQEAVP